MGLGIWLSLSLAVAPPPEAWGPVPADVDACVEERGIDRAQLAYLVTNELEGAAATTAARLGERGARFVVACTDDGVEARIDGSIDARTQVETRGVARTVATRTLALAIIELLSELPEAAPEVEVLPEAEARPVVTPEAAPEPPPTPPSAPARSDATWIVRVGPEALGFVLAPLGLFGGAIDVRHRSSRRVGWLAAAAVHGGRDRATLGTVRAFAASMTAAAVLHGSGGRIDPFGALGIRGGVASLRGRTEDADVATGRVVGGWLGPVVRGGLDGNLGRRAVIGLHLELGWAVLGTRARVEGRAAAGATALWLGGGIAVGWRHASASSRRAPR